MVLVSGVLRLSVELRCSRWRKHAFRLSRKLFRPRTKAQSSPFASSNIPRCLAMCKSSQALRDNFT